MVSGTCVVFLEHRATHGKRKRPSNEIPISSAAGHGFLETSLRLRTEIKLNQKCSSDWRTRSMPSTGAGTLKLLKSKQGSCSVVTGDLLAFTDNKTTSLVVHAPSSLVSHLAPAVQTMLTGNSTFAVHAEDHWHSDRFLFVKFRDTSRVKIYDNTWQ